MSLRRTFAITVRLLAGFRRDHRTLGILFVTPIIVLGLFTLLFRTDAPLPRVGVAGTGQGPVAEAMTAAIEADSTITVTGLAAGDDIDAMVRRGDLDAAIVIPAIGAGGDATLQVVVEGTDQRVAAIVPAALQRAMIAGVASAQGGPPVEVEVRPLYGDGDLDTLDFIGGPFIGLLVFFIVYVVTSISFLRERSAGTLERLMASPLRRAEIVVGYMLGFLALALVQAIEVLGFGLLGLGLYNAGSAWLLLLVVVLLALVALNLGIFLSTFARNEFQAVQFIPLVLAPQILLSGLIVSVASEPGWLQAVSNVLPLTYAVSALRDVMLRGAGLGSSSVQVELAVLAGFCVLAVGAASLTLRREVA